MTDRNHDNNHHTSTMLYGSTASFQKETMTSRVKSQNKDSKIPEYQYFKEKKLLEFLTLKGRESTRQQQEIKQKLNYIQEKNRFIEEEKHNLLEKLNDFNPLNTKEIQTYLDQTEKNQVRIFLRQLMIQEELDIICPRDKQAHFSSTGSLQFGRKKKDMSAGYFRIARNELGSTPKKISADKKPFSRLQPKKERIPTESRKIFAEDVTKEKSGKDKNRKIGSKNIHYNQVLISDDSSEISFTEVKLAQLYGRSQVMQKDLVKGFKSKEHDKKFQNALKNVLRLDIVKE